MNFKPMGSFIAALRKAAGMTQKEVADRLNVSDKAVSRWERNENYPDLSILPELAELFGVTTDELLKGERIVKETEACRTNPQKIKRQSDNLLRCTYATFRTYLWVSALLITIGVLTAIPYLLGILLIIVGILLLLIQHSGAKNKVRSTNLPLDEYVVTAFLKKVDCSTCQLAFSLLIVCGSVGLAFLGNYLVNFVFGIHRGWFANLIVRICGTSFSSHLFFRAIVPIVLVNIWMLYRYHKKFADMVYQDGAAAQVRKLAIKAVSIGGGCLAVLCALEVPIHQAIKTLSYKTNEIITEVGIGSRIYSLLYPASIIIVYFIYRNKRKRYMKDVFFINR